MEKIDVGEGVPRVVVSGLVGKIEMSDLLGREVIVVCNLKPANLRSIKSHAMVLCASDPDTGKTECLSPPAGCVIGERVSCEGFVGDADPVLKPGSSKKVGVWDVVGPELKTSEELVASYKGVPLSTSKGHITVSSLKGTPIK